FPPRRSSDLRPPWRSFPRSSASSSSPTSWKAGAFASSPRRPAPASTRCFHANATRCFTCAAGFRAFTTNSRRKKDESLPKAPPCQDVFFRSARLPHSRRTDGLGVLRALERTDAGDLRTADDHLLASAGTDRPFLDPVSGIPGTEDGPWRLALRHAAALGADDSRRARRVRQGPHRPLRDPEESGARARVLSVPPVSFPPRGRGERAGSRRGPEPAARDLLGMDPLRGPRHHLGDHHLDREQGLADP